MANLTGRLTRNTGMAIGGETTRYVLDTGQKTVEIDVSSIANYHTMIGRRMIFEGEYLEVGVERRRRIFVAASARVP